MTLYFVDSYKVDWRAYERADDINGRGETLGLPPPVGPPSDQEWPAKGYEGGRNLYPETERRRGVQSAPAGETGIEWAHFEVAAKAIFG